MDISAVLNGLTPEQQALLLKGAYKVVVEWDGCPDEKPIYISSRAECLKFMRRNWDEYNQGKMSLCLISCDSGRAESFML